MSEFKFVLKSISGVLTAASLYNVIYDLNAIQVADVYARIL